MRTCWTCKVPVSARRLYCPTCKKQRKLEQNRASVRRYWVRTGKLRRDARAESRETGIPVDDVLTQWHRGK